MVKIGKLLDLNAIVKQDGKMKSDIFKAKGESLYAYAHIHIDTLALTHLHTLTHISTHEECGGDRCGGQMASCSWLNFYLFEGLLFLKIHGRVLGECQVQIPVVLTK